MVKVLLRAQVYVIKEKVTETIDFEYMHIQYSLLYVSFTNSSIPPFLLLRHELILMMKLWISKLFLTN